METTEITATELKTQTIKDFCKERGFVSLSNHVRVNVNGFPYVTFINEKNEAENVYFSKGAAAEVVEGQAVDKELVTKYKIIEATNADGEVRFKLGRGEGARVSVDSLFD